MIDVGYGTALLFHDREGTAVLVDGGYREEGVVLESALSREGVDSLAILVASHGHHDHLEGLTWLLEQGWPVGAVVGNVPEGSARFDSSFWRIVHQRGLPYTQVRRGDTLAAGPFQIRVYHPDTLTRDRNQSSLALSVEAGTRKIFCPADVDSVTQHELSKRYGKNLRSDILVLPHHGDVLDPDFSEDVAPEWALLSVGPNPWGMPVQRTRTELEARGIRLLDTRTSGTVVLSCAKHGVTLVTTTGPNRLKQREAEMNERIRRWTRDR
jgi:competence protein ComEC